MNVGEIIHMFRKERKMTLYELSDKSGVALATLSRIENGKMTGTLKSHMNICRALEVSLPDFYKHLIEHNVEVKAKPAKAEVLMHDRKAVSEPLTTSALSKKMMPIMTRIAKDGRTQPEETKVGTEKFVYVLSGKVEAAVDQEKYYLAKGDTLYFDSSVPHHFENIGTGEAQLISVISPPAVS